MILICSPRCLEYGQDGHPENADRVRAPYEFLRPSYEFLEPAPVDDADILRVHTEAHLQAVKEGVFFDFDTPAYANIYTYAALSAGAAVKASQLALEGQGAFSLMRPPGHHAGTDYACGFCYFNNMAIAVAGALERVDRVAIIDFDCHHGNGTQDIFFGNDRVLYVSLHQTPLFPGTGFRSRQNCLNYAIPSGTAESGYLELFEDALIEVADFGPALIGVSAGFDAYYDDPLTDMKLQVTTFRSLGTMIKELKLPVFSVLEGGYSAKLKNCLGEYLAGLEP